MLHIFSFLPRHQNSLWRRPTTTLSQQAVVGLRSEVSPPSLRMAPTSTWQRLMFWLVAPAPQEVAPPLNRLPGVRKDFLEALADVMGDDADEMRERIQQSRSLRELWHARAEIFRLVGVTHDQSEADHRLAHLSRHFPTRAPRSQFAPLP